MRWNLSCFSEFPEHWWETGTVYKKLSKKKKKGRMDRVTFSPAWMQWDAFGAFQLESREAKLMEDFLDLVVRHR